MQNKSKPKFVRYSAQEITEIADSWRNILLDDPVTDELGRLNLAATFEKYNFPQYPNYRVKKALTNVVKELGFNYISQTCLIKFGTKTSVKFKWEDCKKPAVYSIVCTGSQRRYIGSSVRPDLRRAVHSYWLLNPTKWGNSNVFFGIPSFIKDINKYGYESFQMEIIKTFDPDNFSQEELLNAEKEEIEKADPSFLYNATINPCSEFKYTGLGYRFYFIEDEMRQLIELKLECENKYKALQERRAIRFEHPLEDGEYKRIAREKENILKHIKRINEDIKKLSHKLKTKHS